MATIEEDLVPFLKEKGEQYPGMRAYLQDTYENALAEVEDGESEDNEVELAMQDVNNYIAEQD